MVPHHRGATRQNTHVRAHGNGQENQTAEYKQQAKAIFKTLALQTESRMFIESKNYVFWCADEQQLREVTVVSVMASTNTKADAGQRGRGPHRRQRVH